MKIIKVIVLVFLATFFSGCNLFSDMKSYDVDDYKIIEIAYFNSIDQELLAKFQAEETDKEVLAFIEDEYYLDAYYKSSGMCLALAVGGSGGYRTLNNGDNRYLEVSNEVRESYGYADKGVYDGQNTYCTTEKYESSYPGDEEPELAYELADLFMSETKGEITDEKELEKYTKELSFITADTVGEDEYFYSTIESIKFYDAGTTRLVRIHDKRLDSEGSREGITYIQITLSNDVDEFNEIYDDIYEETLINKEQMNFKNFCENK